jgi:outer membrane biogenesis lipoprotein LolB
MPSRPHQCFTSIAAALLFAACGSTEPDQTAAERTRQEQEKVVRDWGGVFIAEINKTLKDPPSDD